uniref:Uncharacterized protein n=1 Tax=Attheya septentrionalis TaxID=420275 RepID=A0A7S2UKW8_9STRA
MEVCENPIELRYQLEATIWSEKPDHFVVFDIHSKVPLVTIEVKKPIDTSLDKFEKVRGQGFDYLSISKVQGNKCPMHITTIHLLRSRMWRGCLKLTLTKTKGMLTSTTPPNMITYMECKSIGKNLSEHTA